MADEVDRRLNAALDEAIDEYFEDSYNNIVENRTKKQNKRVYVERNREEGHNRLWKDYFCDDPTFPAHLFRRRFRMNKEIFMRIVDRLSENISFFQQKRDAIGRLGLSPLQKCTAALRMLAYGCAADAVDEYLRLGESTALSCLSNFTEGVIQWFGVEYLRRPTPDDLQRLLDIGEIRGFPGMIGSIDCRAPRVQYVVNGHQYDLAYYLTDGIYPKWSTFIQSISLPQGPKAELFAKVQEATRKDVERAFGVLQARFAIVKNPAILWDMRQIGMVMRTCIILHNMIVENEWDGYTQFDTSAFEEGDSSRSSQVDMSYSTDMPSNLASFCSLSLLSLTQMALSKSSVVALVAVIVSVVATVASAQSESPAPSPTSGSGAFSPSIVSAGVAAVAALVFGSALRI
ncbi:uncharacterized protein LOC106424527 [Brassica napus]|nr:uncharacterized protein LOC106424527 [Brassica napus]